MFINECANWNEMSPEFKQAEEQHFDNLPAEFDDALFFDLVKLFFGL